MSTTTSNQHTAVPGLTEQHPRKALFRTVPKTHGTPPDLHKHPATPLFRANLFGTPISHHVSAGQRLFRLFPYYVGGRRTTSRTTPLRHVGPPAGSLR